MMMVVNLGVALLTLNCFLLEFWLVTGEVDMRTLVYNERVFIVIGKACWIGREGERGGRVEGEEGDRREGERGGR